MPLSSKQVRHVAALARLNLTPSEIEKFSHDLTKILDYVGQLADLDTDGVEPKRQFVQAENVFREDKIRPSLPREKALANAPDRDEAYLLVPKVIG